MDAKLELISFPICPFVQRSVIMLGHKGVDFALTHIDLANKPEWFTEISPFGKVPVLRTNGAVLFESTVINEYLDEISPPSLHPRDPLVKAQNRAWIEYASELQGRWFAMATAASQLDYEQAAERLAAGLVRVDEQLKEGPFWNGPELSLVDIAFAPLLWRVAFVESHRKLPAEDARRGLAGWWERLRALEAVARSVPENFEELATQFLQRRRSWLVSHVAE